MMSASGFLNPVMVIHTVGAFVAVIATAWLALHLILVRVFYTCHFGVHAAITLHKRRQFPSGMCIYHNNNDMSFICIIIIMQVKLDMRVRERV